MRPLRFLFCFLFLAAASPSARAGDDERVAAQVRGFYQWYFHLINTTPGESEIKGHRKEFGRYVTAKFLHHIEHMSEGEGQEGDPFFLQPDWDPAWEKNIEIVRVKVVAKGAATAEVRLNGKEMPSKHLRVTLMLEGGDYKFTKVEEIRDDAPLNPTATAAPTATP